MPTTIVLKDGNDVAFAHIAQGAIVTGAILPSGLQIPKTGRWIITQDTVVNVASTSPE